MKPSFSDKPFALSGIFGILLMWLDFGDSFPLNDSVGNLDQIFGHTFWYATEVFLVLAPIAVFLLFGRALFDIGKHDRGDGLSSTRAPILTRKTIGPFLLYIVLLLLIGLDDIVKVMGINSSLDSSNLSPAYWVPMEAIYPIGSMIALVLFGRACYRIGENG